MAKKEQEIEGYNKEVGGAGWKRCPGCEGYVKGPLTKVCPACKHEFTFKSRMMAKPTSEAAQRTNDLEQHVMLLALKMGSLSKVSSSVEKLKADPLINFTIKCGGVENTIRIVQAIEGKVASVQS